MPLKFHPKPGMVLICDFTTGFQPPEIVKKRPVIVVSPRRRRGQQLCMVIPLSTKKPKPVEAHHHLISPHSLPDKLAQRETWAKCDIVATISLERLDRLYSGKDRSGKRRYESRIILPGDLQAIQRGILAALGLHNLTFHL